MLIMNAELALALIAVAIIGADLAGMKKRGLGLLFTGLTAALLVFVACNRSSGEILDGAYVADGIAWFAKLVILLATVLVGGLSSDLLGGRDKNAGAYYAVLALSTLGMMYLVSSKELITMYIALELATISLYALTALDNRDGLALEGGIKYLILGATSSAILLYGMSLVYGVTHTTYLDRIAAFTAQNGFSPVMIIALIMLILGVGFKLSMVPMHVWTPDVYQGAPAVVAAFISTASKTAGFVFAIRLFSHAFAQAAPVWTPILAVLAVMTMFVGNLIAMHQTNLKRLLAYSTISQAGYILVGFIGAPVVGISSVLFYLLAYTVTNIAAFGVVAAFGRATGSDDLSAYSGLSRTQPVLALTLMLALLSLAGIPPLAGFTGKVYLFYAAMQQGYLWLVIIAALNSTISLYYYLLILKKMYMGEVVGETPKVILGRPVTAVLVITVLAMFLFGIYPEPLFKFTQEIAQQTTAY